MPSTLSPAWVKNVYSLRIDGGTDGEQTYTERAQNARVAAYPVHKHPTLSQLLHVLEPDLSTYISRQFNPLINHLYPLSTVPTTTETKEN